jgi:integrase
MGRKRQWPPSVLHHKPTDTDRVRYWAGDERVEVTLGKHDSPEAREKYARLLAELAAAQPRRRAGQALTCAALIADYTLFAQTYHEPRQLGRIRRALQGVLDLYASTPAAAFGPVALETVLARFVAGGLARPYVNNLMHCVRGCWSWGVRKELVPPACYEALLHVPALRRGKTTAREPDPVLNVEWAVVEKTLPHLLPQTAAMVRLQTYTGCRPGEVCALRPCDVEQDLLVVDNVKIWVYTPATHKTAHRGRTRKAALGPNAQAVLAPYLERDPSLWCFSPREAVAEWMEAHGRAYRPGRTRQPGLRYLVSSYDHAVRTACARAGVVAWHPHQLRHLAATVVEEVTDEEEARALLGHAGLAQTRRYAHADLLKAAKVAALLG